METKLLGIVGSNVPTSTNRKLMNALKAQVSDQANVTIADLAALPLFDKPAKDAIPAVVTAFCQQVAAADGVIIATPEYDHSVPAVLLNALEWVAYSSRALANKPVLIIGAAYGKLGSDRAQAQLRQILLAPDLQAAVLPGEFQLANSLAAFDDHGALLHPADQDGLTYQLAAFLQAVADNKSLI